MRSLVTGGSGFIGTHLCRHLLTCGHRVLNLDALTYAAVKDTPPDIRDHPNYAFLQADIADATAVRQALHDFQPDRIFHLAAETHVDRSITDAAPFLHTNVLGTHTLLETSLDYLKNQKFVRPDIGGVESATHSPPTTTPTSASQSSGFASTETREAPSSCQRFSFSDFQHLPFFLHISTDEVYGHLGPDDPPFTESSPILPRSPYAASKAAAEHLVRAWHITHGLPAIIVRPSNNFGPYQHGEKLIPTIIRSALAGEPVPIYGDGSNIRDWIHVEDHVRALALIATQGTPGETYNIGANHEISNLQLATLILSIISKIKLGELGVLAVQPSPSQPPPQSPISFTPDRPGHDFRYAIDTTKLRTQLAWHPTRDFHSSLSELLRFHMKGNR